MECPICFEPTGESITFSCQHSICLSCYQSLLERENTIKCPLCRHVIEELTPIIEPVRQSRVQHFPNDQRVATGCGVCIALIILGVVYLYAIHK